MYAACLEIFKKHEISDSEIDEETLEYLVDGGNEVDQADRSDQLELLQMYLPTAEMDNLEELLDDMIMLSKDTIRLRTSYAVSNNSICNSTSCAFLNIKEQEVKEDESDSTKQKQAWMASQDNKECQSPFYNCITKNL